MSNVVELHPAAAADSPDVPVDAIIKRHKALSIEYHKAVNHPDVGDLDRKNPEAEREARRAQTRLIRFAKRLFAFQPSSVDEVATLLRYISSLKDWQMPTEFAEAQEIGGLKKLCLSMADALSNAERAVPVEGYSQQHVDHVHSEAFRDMEGEVCDLDRAGEIARDLIMNCKAADDGSNDLELTVFAVGQFADMAKAFRANYYKRWHDEH